MKKTIKRIGLLTMLALLIGVVVACSPKDTEKDKTEDKGNEGEQILQIFIPGYEDEIWKGLYDKGINDFEAENQGVKVEVIPAGWDEANSKIIGLIQANEAPDVMITGSRSLRQFAELGAIEPLDQFMTEDFIGGRVKTVLDTANIDKVQYGIPLGFSSRALYYRTDLIETPPTNWDELYEIAAKVK